MRAYCRAGERQVKETECLVLNAAVIFGGLAYYMNG
jgi:hypothetical protein